MFILYAIPIGIVVGLLAGRPSRGPRPTFASAGCRWSLLGLLVQVAVFTDAVGRAVGDAGPAIYVASTVAVFVAVLRNVRVPGVVLIAIGAGCNLAAIIANGGCMPADPDGARGRRRSRRRLHEQHRRPGSGAAAADRHLRPARLAAVRERLQHRRRAHRRSASRPRSRSRCGPAAPRPPTDAGTCNAPVSARAIVRSA